MKRKGGLLFCCCFSHTTRHTMTLAMAILQTIYLDSRKALPVVDIRKGVLKIHLLADTIPLASLEKA